MEEQQKSNNPNSSDLLLLFKLVLLFSFAQFYKQNYYIKFFHIFS